MAYAIQNGNFGSASTWDTGVVPSGSDDVYANGFTIQVNGTQSLGRVRNDTSDYYLPNTATALMTSSTSPSGIVTTTSQVAGLEAWKVFDRNTSTYWQTAASVTSASITYQFSSTRIVKRYMWKASTTATAPRDFTFQGSNDGSSWTTLDTQTSINVGTNGIFTSSLLPNTTPYLYYRLSITTNNGASAIVVTEFEMTESTSTSVGQIVGGTFNLLNGTNLTVTANTGVVVNSATAPVTFALNSPNSATINGNIISPAISTNQTAISHTGTGTLNMNGNHSNNSSGGRVIQVTGGGTLNIVGTPNNASSGISPTYDLSAGATVNMTGNVTTSGTYIFYYRGACNLTITGNVSAVGAIPILTNGGNLTIIGNVSASGAFACITNINSACTMNVTGTPTAGSGANAIVGLGLVRVTGNPINTSRFMAIYAPQVTIDATTNSWTFQQFAGGDITLYASGASLGNPVQADVRFGTTYGPSGTLTGTLRVPNPNTVLLGVLTDNTTGTLLMTPQQFWEALTSAVTLVGSFGKLIKDFLNAAVGSIPTNPVLDTDSRLNYLDAPISGVGGSVDLTPVLDAIADIPTNPLLDDDVRVDDIKERTDKIPDYPASVQSTGEQIASYQT